MSSLLVPTVPQLTPVPAGQVLINYMLYSNLFSTRVRLWSYGTGLVNNRVLLSMRYNEEQRARLKNEQGDVLNLDGTVSAVVHKGPYLRRTSFFQDLATRQLQRGMMPPPPTATGKVRCTCTTKFACHTEPQTPLFYGDEV